MVTVDIDKVDVEVNCVCAQTSGLSAKASAVGGLSPGTLKSEDDFAVAVKETQLMIGCLFLPAGSCGGAVQPIAVLTTLLLKLLLAL